MQEVQVPSLGREDPWRRKWQPTPVFLPEKSHGRDRGALVSYSLWCRKRVGHDSQLTIQQQQNEQENFCYSFRECSFPLPLSVSILEYRCLPPSLQQQDLREWWRLFWFGENYICYFYVTLFKWRKKAFN